MHEQDVSGCMIRMFLAAHRKHFVFFALPIPRQACLSAVHFSNALLGDGLPAVQCDIIQCPTTRLLLSEVCSKQSSMGKI